MAKSKQQPESQPAIRMHPRRHRRLDLSAWARRVLSKRPDTGRRARLRSQASHLDRDQRYALPSAKPKELPQLGGDRAGRFRLLRQRPAARDAAEGPGRDRRLHRSLLKVGARGTRRQAWTARLAVRALQALRRGRFRQPLGVAAPRVPGAASSTTSSRFAINSFGVPRFRRNCWRASGVTCRRCRRQELADISPIAPAMWSMRGGKEVTTRSRRRIRPANSMLGPGRARIWAQAARPMHLPRLDARRQSEVEPGATHSSISSDEGKRRAPAVRHGVDRAARV